MTHRQFEAWEAWLDLQEAEPSLTDRYLMQVAMEVHRLNWILSDKQPSLSIGDFQLQFRRILKRKKTKAEQEAQRRAYQQAEVEMSQAIWAYRMGGFSPNSSTEETGS